MLEGVKQFHFTIGDTVCWGEFKGTILEVEFLNTVYEQPIYLVQLGPDKQPLLHWVPESELVHQ
jgi:hypothetical protein